MPLATATSTHPWHLVSWVHTIQSTQCKPMWSRAIPHRSGSIDLRAIDDSITVDTASTALMNASRPQPGGRRPRARTKRTRPKRKNARKWQTHARKRGIQRWSSLLTAESSRLAKANSMRQFLGERCWDSIVQCANKHYREAFLQSFTPHDGVLRCKGPLSSISGSTKCPQGFRVAARHLGLRCDAGDGPPRERENGS